MKSFIKLITYLILLVVYTQVSMGDDSCYESDLGGIQRYVSANSSVEKSVQPGSRNWKWSLLTKEAGQGGRCPNYFLQKAIGEQTTYWQSRKNNCNDDAACVAKADAEIRFLSSMNRRQGNATRVRAEVQRENCSLLQRNPQKKDCQMVLSERFDKKYLEKLNSSKDNITLQSCVTGVVEAVRQTIQSGLDGAIGLSNAITGLGKKLIDGLGFVGCQVSGACASLSWGEMALANDINSIYQATKNINPARLLQDIVASVKKEYTEVYQCMSKQQKVMLECEYMTYLAAALNPFTLSKISVLLKAGKSIFKATKPGEPLKIEFVPELKEVIPKERRLPPPSATKPAASVIDVEAREVRPLPALPNVSPKPTPKPAGSRKNSVDLINDKAEMDQLRKPVNSLSGVKSAIGLPPDATRDQVIKQLRKLKSKYHHDKNPDVLDATSDVRKALNDMHKLVEPNRTR